MVRHDATAALGSYQDELQVSERFLGRTRWRSRSAPKGPRGAVQMASLGRIPRAELQMEANLIFHRCPGIWPA